MNKNIMKAMGFNEELKNIDSGLCPTCGGVIGEFLDELSYREFKISGMCQACQDKTFGGEE